MVYDNGGFDGKRMNDPKVRKLISETARVLCSAIAEAIPHEVPAELRYGLEENAFIFSGFKTFHSLREVGLSMIDEKGNIKPLADFQEDVQAINAQYNTNYLRAEYNHALGSTLMAVKWQELAQDTDRYYLQYRTAEDEKVRETHQLLNNTTLPADDPFWDKYYPPNGWGCRCTVVKVRRSKYEMSDPKMAMLRGDNATEAAKQKMFRFNPGKEMKLFPDTHPYFKAPAKDAEAVKQVSAEELKKMRIAELRAQLPDTLTDAEKDAKAANNYEIEQTLKIKCGEPMSVEQADKQNANPNYAKSKEYRINCQTCTPAYMLRLQGFDITAKANTKGSMLDYLSRGFNAWEIWQNTDGTPAKHTTINSWLESRGYKKMTQNRWIEFFNEICKDEGVYALSIGWKGRGGHMTVLQRFADGTLRYIEPQLNNSQDPTRNIDYLAKYGAGTQHDCRGIMRIDNKVFNTKYLSIFDKTPQNVQSGKT